MAGVLVFGETAEGQLLPVSFELAAAGRAAAEALGEPLVGALIGINLGRAAEEFRRPFKSLYLADSPHHEPYTAAVFADAAEAVIRQCSPSAVLFPHTSDTREWVPRLAFRLGTGLVTDCVAITSDGNGLSFTKPVYGGCALGEYRVHGSPSMATIREKVFAPDTQQLNGDLIEVNAAARPARTEVLEEVRESPLAGPRLKDAKVIVSGGRGIGGPEHWHYVEEAAAALGAAVGCSRPVADAGWLPSSYQVGLSGSNVAPDVYIAVALSGAVQHLSGISGARTVVAINTDPEAPIFGRARYGAVADYKEVLPAFTNRVRQLRG